MVWVFLTDEEQRGEGTLTEYFFGLIFTPALAPPNGTSGTDQLIMQPEQTAGPALEPRFKHSYVCEDTLIKLGPAPTASPSTAVVPDPMGCSLWS